MVNRAIPFPVYLQLIPLQRLMSNAARLRFRLPARSSVFLLELTQSYGDAMDRRDFAQLMCASKFTEMLLVPGGFTKQMEEGTTAFSPRPGVVYLAAGDIGPIEAAARALKSLGAPVYWTLGAQELLSATGDPWAEAHLATADSEVRVLCRDEVEVGGMRIGGTSFVASCAIRRVGALRPTDSVMPDSLMKVIRQAYADDAAWLADFDARHPDDDTPYVVLSSAPQRRRDLDHMGMREALDAVGHTLQNQVSNPLIAHEASVRERAFRSLSTYATLHVRGRDVFLPQQCLRPVPTSGAALRGARLRIGAGPSSGKEATSEMQSFSLGDCAFEASTSSFADVAVEPCRSRRRSPHLRQHILDWANAVAAIDAVLATGPDRYRIEALPLAALAHEHRLIAGVFVESDMSDQVARELRCRIRRVANRIGRHSGCAGTTRIDVIPVRSVAALNGLVPLLSEEATSVVLEVLGYSALRRGVANRASQSPDGVKRDYRGGGDDTFTSENRLSVSAIV